jgi:phenylalanyl-tRNA synthetase beta chain
VKASVRWIRALVPRLTASPVELAARFSAAGLEVEAIHEYGEASDACVVAAVVGTRAHPTKSGLSLVTVDRGAAAPLEVVCGASNVPAPGGLVVLAPLGARLPAKGVTIERRTIAGVTSEGMLCSEAELGLAEDARDHGILVLPAGTAAPGTLLSHAVPATRDTILEIGLTPNRPDCLGHLGLAREAAALYGLAWGPPAPDAPGRAVEGRIDSYVKVSVEDQERCPHYAAAVVVDVTIGPSPAWVRYRLGSLGIRPISNVVDVTNLVLLEYGHPMHAFDLERVRGGVIVVRRAKAGETLTTLDGVVRSLVEDDLVIGDGEGPDGLAGVMGGAASEISPSTKRVLLECAYFDPRGVRRTARRHGLHTEASHRFERGVDPGDIPDALTHAAALLTHLAGGAAVPGAIHVLGKAEPPRVLTLRSKRLDQVLGTPVPFKEATDILERLGCNLSRAGSRDGVAELAVPSHRPDIAREIDLVEEVARVRGMDAIPTVLPAVRPSGDEGPREQILARARHAGVEMGLSEAVTYAFVSRESLTKVGAPEPAVTLKNPLSVDQEVMRTSLLPGLLGALSNARRRGERDVRQFTVGPLFLANLGDTDGLPEERLAFAAVVAGDRPAYLSRPEPVDVWDGKGVAMGLVRRVTGIDAVVRAFAATDRPSHLHPRGAGRVTMAAAEGADGIGGEELGRFGLLHPDVATRFDLGAGPVVVVEIDLARLTLFASDKRRAVAIARFPAATRDVALVVDESVPAGEVLGAVRLAAGTLAEQVALFDRFTGGAIAAGHQSLAFHVVYRAPDRTLTDAEVDAQHAKVVAEVNRRFGATLRT